MSVAHDIEKGLRTQDIRISQDVTFDTMLLESRVLDGLKQSGFYRPSPIQLHGIPLGKCGFDLLLEAKSGTGKTAVFTVIALEKLDMQKGLQIVILAPTREIAAQICDVIRQIGSAIEGLNVEVVMGGLSVQEDILKFSKKDVHIVVGSPGRLRHLIQDKYIDVSAVRLLVLDEADKLVEKSFLPDINYIFSVLPEQKQIIMSSATFPEASKIFIDKYVHNAQYVCPDTNSILLGIEQKVTIVKYNSNIVKQTQFRLQELLKILSHKQFKQCLIFCNYQTRVVELHKMLTRENWPAEQLYGQQEQSDRLDALKILQDYKCRILISTDLAARGIDASNVDLVINFEPPFEWQTYLHRIGRAGRFGSYGIAVTIVSEGKEVTKFNETLTALKGTVNLKDFWNDSKINNGLDSLQQSSVIVNSNGVNPKINSRDDLQNFDELWNLITLGYQMEIKSEIESFEGLCKSLQETEDTKLETFCELLTSFDNPIVETIQDELNNTRKYWNNELKLVKQYFDFMQSSGNEENVSKVNNDVLYYTDKIKKEFSSKKINGALVAESPNTVTDFGECIQDIELNKIVFNSPEYSSINYNSNSKNNNEELSVERSNDNLVADAPNIRANECGDFIDYQFNGDHETEALRKAGLPTAFASSRMARNKSEKHKVIHRKKYNKVCVEEISSNNDTEKNNYINEYNTGNRNLLKKIVDSETFKNNTQYGYSSQTTSNDCSNLEYNYSVGNNHSLLQKVKENQSNVVYDVGEIEFKEPQTKINSHNMSNGHGIQISSRRVSQNYVNWYNQLKLQVKQIELAVYIDEMSKF